MIVTGAEPIRVGARRYACFAVLCLVLTSSAGLGSQEILRNSDIVTMTTARLSAETIILKIETTATQFDTSSDAVAVLKAAGVAEAVIAAMIKASPAKPSAPAASKPAAPAPPPDPAPARPAKAGGRPLLLVQPFKVAASVTWPYDAQQLQSQTVLILQTKDRIKERFDVSANADDAEGPVYTLHGEVTSWKAGNRATRLLVGLGQGRESADIRYWLTDAKGTRIFDREDTIRAAFLGNTFAASVGQLAEPFAAKLAERLGDVRLPER